MAALLASDERTSRAQSKNAPRQTAVRVMARSAELQAVHPISLPTHDMPHGFDKGTQRRDTVSNPAEWRDSPLSYRLTVHLDARTAATEHLTISS